ncbi:Protein of unknown function [Nitrosomonas marina]|uniref:PEP-CTERM protein-sorting domain-containing protein n=2 Tax=Nitrosomonas marina TaxID=917 RepID=A0A1I0DVE0_9PROT|nr:Protein of unknown function [Nitrosomonas marina]
MILARVFNETLITEGEIKMKNRITKWIMGALLVLSVYSVHAVPVDVELILATDTSGSVDAVDFALRRDGIEAAFRSPTVINAIENGTIGSIAVTLWDFGTNVGVAVDWMQISNAAQANAFADAVAAAGRLGGGGDGQANMIREATIAITTNNYEGRGIIDITSEGVQSGEGCTYTSPDCQATRDAGAAFLAAGGSAINAIWMNDRNFFGLDQNDLVDAFEYGSLSVITGAGAFQVFAETNQDFIDAIDDKIIREIQNPPTGVPTPGSLLLMALGFVVFRLVRQK